MLSCENGLQKRTNHVVATFINKIGSVTMGVYFIHVIFLRTLNHSVNPMIPIFNNEGSLVQMILSAVIYFIISIVVCLSASNVKAINKLF